MLVRTYYSCAMYKKEAWRGVTLQPGNGLLATNETGLCSVSVSSARVPNTFYGIEIAECPCVSFL